MKIVIVTGGFDPIHSGHIKYLEDARQLGDRMIVGLNSDEWLARKKGRAFMPWEERAKILKAMSVVGYVMPFDDSDGSACDLLEEIKRKYPYAEIIFANGGDRTATNIPEMNINGVLFKFGVGGTDKANSSSWILEEWKNPKTVRSWGWYRVLDDKPGYKVKELIIEPGKSLSMQRHFFRSEHWYVLKGKCDIITDGYSGIMSITKMEHETYQIQKTIWHQGQNNYNEPCHILEVQYGDKCIEDDIERK